VRPSGVITIRRPSQSLGAGPWTYQNSVTPAGSPTRGPRPAGLQAARDLIAESMTLDDEEKALLTKSLHDIVDETQATPLAAARFKRLIAKAGPEWLNNWSGVGLIIDGMTHQGWDVQLTAYAARDWRANFFPVGIAHSIVGGSAQEPTPWRAVKRAAWVALGKQ
jgi:hypothetical protein